MAETILVRTDKMRGIGIYLQAGVPPGGEVDAFLSRRGVFAAFAIGLPALACFFPDVGVIVLILGGALELSRPQARTAGEERDAAQRVTADRPPGPRRRRKRCRTCSGVCLAAAAARGRHRPANPSVPRAPRPMPVLCGTRSSAYWRVLHAWGQVIRGQVPDELTMSVLRPNFPLIL